MKINLITGNSLFEKKTMLSTSKTRNNFLETFKKNLIEIKKNQETEPVSGKLSSFPKNNTPSLFHLGTITHDQSTVSDLLVKHPKYRKNLWGIIHSELNKNKPFTKIQPDTKIFLNPESLEIVWEYSGNTPPQKVAKDVDSNFLLKPERQDDSFSEKLVDAVKPFIGKSYDEINCYELIVNGLKKLGVQYQGQGGLKEKLVKMAEEKGFSDNALLSGEGLVEASGSLIYSKSIPYYINSENKINEVMEEINPMLKRGFVLSFSTPTRGHTGIVSGEKELWTYINSGRLDHQIGDYITSKGVGEETLAAEIRNWFRLAANRRESLQITLGRLDEKKLVMSPHNPLYGWGRV